MLKDYINGSDLLLGLGQGKTAVAKCTSHTTTFNTETKERAVKPVAGAASSQSQWKEKGVTGKSVTITAEGLRFGKGDTEFGFKELLAAYRVGKSIPVIAYERGNSAAPYLEGKFVITSLEESTPAQDDATYSVTLENDGYVKIIEENISSGPADPDEEGQDDTL
ncbi:MAG: phage tail protein [Pseudoflavonifractor sp.]|nr:phage tail protein [Pseudoflavonifractor sp.]